MTDKSYWLTDLGQDVELVSLDGGPPQTVGRYGVWHICNHRAECVEASTDLEALRAKYGLSPDAPVHSIGKPGTVD